ncbi:YggS family pyridoxal phosphate-dependent enzyme [Nisaea acidiphila]|uniref:Pyridoxal phosphate homeostasis protein n=1 Tax=Nisaea acidiphila TaxID=1862145 RepID=A0A9J7ALW5_9PROT|nr:YggS family pyridoxal phosphate-dependent enzyme [Nisaea acidiphila]UUX47954.1 YggS family pyridoxal phosphate-dependent enzyme [Nisaea acidiphila]
MDQAPNEVAVDIAANLQTVRDQIAAAAKTAGRAPDEVTLVAVGKVQPVERVEAALAAGQRIFGENRVQEAQGKWPALKERFPDVTLHLIGPLQTNKAADAIALFDVIETVDRPKLARVLAAEMTKQGRALECFIQVNTGEEEQKAGVLPAEADAFIATCRDEHGLNVTGLMCIPPADEEPALHFALLREIARQHGLEKLSMGMSGDYETAIEFGATHVRVGTAIFGQRQKPAG